MGTCICRGLCLVPSKLGLTSLAIVGWFLTGSLPDASGQCELQPVVASDGAVQDQFGWTVDIDGNYAVVASSRDDDSGESSGSVYVFRNDSGTWIEEQKLTASDAGLSDEFGVSVAISGDLIAVGAHREDEPCPGGSDCNAGAVYLFRYNGTSWVEEQKVFAGDADDNDNFGNSVDVDGTALVVGCHHDDDLVDSGGSAYIFRFDGTSWNEEIKLEPTTPMDFHAFGNRVAIRDDLVAVATPELGVPGFVAGGTGRVDLYRYDGTTWQSEATLTPSDGVESDLFGSAISIGDGRVLVGAPGRDEVCPVSVFACNSGAAYVYCDGPGGWAEEEKLVPSSAAVRDLFGISCSLVGNVAVVGASQFALPPALGGTGQAIIFKRIATEWVEQVTLLGSTAVNGDRFGQSVALSADTLIVGSPEIETGGSGAALLFSLDGCGVSVGSQFLRGDCNNDGGFDISDAVFLLDELFGPGQSPECVSACDSNDDDGLDIADAVSMLETLFLLPTPLPAPSGSCGIDPTPDMLTCDAPSCP